MERATSAGDHGIGNDGAQGESADSGEGENQRHVGFSFPVVVWVSGSAYRVSEWRSY